MIIASWGSGQLWFEIRKAWAESDPRDPFA
jgi:hypothetical protein